MLIKSLCSIRALVPVSAVFLSLPLFLYFWLISWNVKAGCVTQGILASFLLSLSHLWLWTIRFRSIKGPTASPLFFSFQLWLRHTPGSSVVENLTVSAGDAFPGSGISPGEGTGDPPQFSCLENSMDRGAWQATVHRVRKSQTRLSDWAHILLSVFKTFIVSYSYHHHHLLQNSSFYKGEKHHAQ